MKSRLVFLLLAVVLVHFIGSVWAVDPVTARVSRDPATVFARVRVQTDADRETARHLGRVVEDYGSFLVIALTPGAKAANRLDLAPLETTIHIHSFHFDPLRENPAAPYRTMGGYRDSGAADDDYYLVQFAAPVRDEWLDDVRTAGGDVIQYVPHQAFLVRASPSAIAAIDQLPTVRWTGLYQPVHRLPRELMWSFGGAGQPLAGRAIYDVAVFKRADRAAVRRGGTVRREITLPANYFDVLRMELDPAAVKALAQLPDVATIDPYVAPEKEDERAAHIVAGNYTSQTSIAGPGYDSLAQFGVDGTNVTVSVVDDGVGIPGDSGFYITASNATNGPLRGATAGADGHGHLNATIIAGSSPFSVLDPTGHNYALGVSRRACIVNIPLLRSGYTGVEADTVNDTVTTSGPNGVKGSISNNSWGSGVNGNAYDSFAAEYDGYVQDASAAGTIDPLCIVFSAGNSGTSGLTRPKVAKNVISVANSENLRAELYTSANNIDQIESSSSRGPAADGRVKPDITAPGTAIAGGRSGTDALFGNIDAAHRWSVGTSHAAPQVAGAAALFTQFWKNTHAGTNPSPAIIKAALINSAVDMNSTTSTAPIPNGDEGWGRINLKNVLNTGVPIQYIDQTVAMATVGDQYTFNGVTAITSRPVRVSLVWTDPPGISDPALVNNLDLEVTVGGITYKGNAFSSGVSVSGGAADTINNVENVFLPVVIAAGTPLTVVVRAAALNGNGILGNADATDQHFALVVFNADEATGPIVAAAGETLTGENCAPGNGAIDPGEMVTVSLALKNTGTANASNVVATLQSTGGTQTYGLLNTNGVAVSRPFSFTAAGACGSNFVATLQLQDGTNNLGSVNYNFVLGSNAATTNTFANSATITIPANGNSGAASPYPSTISVAALSGTLSKVTVTLTNINHAAPDDMDVLLVGPGGQSVVLMSDAGGASALANVTLTFDDAAPASLPDATAIASGVYKPTNIGAGDSFPSPASTNFLGAALSIFNGTDPNGTWSLYVVDDANPNKGSIAQGWKLALVTTISSCCSSTANQPPVVTNAFVTPSAPNTTQNLSAFVFASDPNSNPVTFAYQWQDSTNSVAFANLAGQTASTLLSNVTVAGNYYRFIVTPNDGLTNGAPVTTMAVQAALDSDSDGLNDDWEITHFGSLAAQSGTNDPDGDGFDNAQEFFAGTDPNNAASLPLITAITPSGSDVLITFSSVAGKSYTVERATDLVPMSWSPVTNVTATGSSSQITDAGAAALSQRFYRVHVLP